MARDMTLEEALINLNNAAYRALRIASKSKADASQIERLQTLAKLSDQAVDAPVTREVSNATQTQKDQVA